jgi:hypothetical protein
MGNLDSIQHILNSQFLSKEKTKFVEEQDSFTMEIPIKSDGCQFLSYKYDKELKGFKGGLFPFFAQNKGVQKISDYVIFAEKGNQLYVLLVELKRGNASARPQLEAAKCFVSYIISSVKRVKNISIEPQLRCITISEFKRFKKSTQEKPIQYTDNFTEFKGTIFRLRTFLI